MDNSNNIKLISYLLYGFAFLTAFLGVIIMTDIGQLFGIEKSVVVWYFKNSLMIMLISAALYLVGLYLDYSNHVLAKKWTIVFGSVWLLCILASKYLTPYVMFMDQQNSAKYIPVSEATDYIDEDQRLLVVDYNGAQKAYPPENIWQAHIFGGDYNGEELIFTYCVMSDLGIPYKSEINGDKVNFKVLAQTNNNLLIWDTESDEIIQQITQQCEFSKTRLEPIPVMEMSYKNYKKLYPNGEVLYNTWDNPIEKTIAALFDTEDTWHGEEFMFNTTKISDDRLPMKEHIIGIADQENGEYLGLTKDYIKKNGHLNVTVGKKELAVVYFPEYETIGCFNRNVNGEIVNAEGVSIHGETEYGKLDKEYLFNLSLIHI